jgi:hypothetical protein
VSHFLIRSAGRHAGGIPPRRHHADQPADCSLIRSRRDAHDTLPPFRTPPSRQPCASILPKARRRPRKRIVIDRHTPFSAVCSANLKFARQTACSETSPQLALRQLHSITAALLARGRAQASGIVRFFSSLLRKRRGEAPSALRRFPALIAGQTGEITLGGGQSAGPMSTSGSGRPGHLMADCGEPACRWVHPQAGRAGPRSSPGQHLFAATPPRRRARARARTAARAGARW